MYSPSGIKGEFDTTGPLKGSVRQIPEGQGMTPRDFDEILNNQGMRESRIPRLNGVRSNDFTLWKSEARVEVTFVQPYSGVVLIMW